MILTKKKKKKKKKKKNKTNFSPNVKSGSVGSVKLGFLFLLPKGNILFMCVQKYT